MPLAEHVLLLLLLLLCNFLVSINIPLPSNYSVSHMNVVRVDFRVYLYNLQELELNTFTVC